MHITHIEHREAIPNDEMLAMLRETKPTAFEASEPLLYGGSFFFLQRKADIDELARSSLEALVSAKADLQSSFKLLLDGVHTTETRDDAPRVVPFTPISPKYVIESDEDTKFFGFDLQPVVACKSTCPAGCTTIFS